MMLRVSNPASVGEEAPHADLSGAGAVKASPPADFVHDNGQILLELLRGREGGGAGAVEGRSE